MILKIWPNILHTWTKIFYTAKLCQNVFQRADLRG